MGKIIQDTFPYFSPLNIVLKAAFRTTKLPTRVIRKAVYCLSSNVILIEYTFMKTATRETTIFPVNVFGVLKKMIFK